MSTDGWTDKQSVVDAHKALLFSLREEEMLTMGP